MRVDSPTPTLSPAEVENRKHEEMKYFHSHTTRYVNVFNLHHSANLSHIFTQIFSKLIFNIKNFNEKIN